MATLLAQCRAMGEGAEPVEALSGGVPLQVAGFATLAQLAPSARGGRGTAGGARKWKPNSAFVWVPTARVKKELKVSSKVMAGDWSTTDYGEVETPNLHLVWAGIPADRVEEILRRAWGGEDLEEMRFYQGLQAEELAAVKEAEEFSDLKTLGSWLELFGVVWRAALGELSNDAWMVCIRSVDDLSFVLELMMKARGRIPLRDESDFSGWRSLFVEVSEMLGKLA